MTTSGALNTVQDLGRTGFRHIGVSTSGAMDELALRVANLLVGNDEAAAGIELQTYPFQLTFLADARVAVTGASSPLTRLANKALPPWWARNVRAGETLVVAQPTHGARSYIALAGGIDVPSVLGSRSTHLRSGFGGLEGRALAAGDRLGLLPAPSWSPLDAGVLPPPIAMPGLSEGDVLKVRALRAADYDVFPRAAQAALWETPWTITAQSNRAGYRLKGQPLLLDEPMELRSYGIVAGIVQVPPSGLPIVQLSDANTAGGYPRIAGVIEADLWRLGQARLGSRVQFVETDYESAVAAMRPLEEYLVAIRDTLPTVLDMNARLSAKQGH